MKDSKPSFILYVLASVLAIAGRVMDCEILQLVAKPMVVPAIYYFYLQTKTRRTSWVFSAVLTAFFLGDMAMLLDPENGLFGVMIAGTVAHLLLINLALSDRSALKFSLFNLSFLAILLFLPSYILYTLLHLSVDSINENYFLFLSYGVILIFFVGLSVIQYLSHGDAPSLYLCTAALALLTSDLLYSISRFIMEMTLLVNINLAAQFLAYYFLVRYFNSRPYELKLRNA